MPINDLALGKASEPDSYQRTWEGFIPERKKKNPCRLVITGWGGGNLGDDNLTMN